LARTAAYGLLSRVDMAFFSVKNLGAILIKEAIDRVLIFSASCYVVLTERRASYSTAKHECLIYSHEEMKILFGLLLATGLLSPLFCAYKQV